MSIDSLNDKPLHDKLTETIRLGMVFQLNSGQIATHCLEIVRQNQAEQPVEEK